MIRGCQSSDDENVRYYRLVNGSKCLPAPFQRKKQKQNLCRWKCKPSGAEHFESEVDGMVRKPYRLPLLFAQLFTITVQALKSKSQFAPITSILLPHCLKKD